MTIHKSIKKLTTLLTAGLLLTSSAFMFTSCNSDWPKATVNVEFNNKTYSIAYKLNRKFFPHTVQHFIELADGGYYDGLCVHNYTGAGMYTGNYEYSDADNYNLKERNYYTYIQEKNLSLTPSVYALVEPGKTPTDALQTVSGEFSYTIKNNDKKYGAEKVGSLVMYYSAIDSDVNDLLNQVTVKNPYSDGYSNRAYKNNCATSQFYFSLTQSSAVNKNYTVFADLFSEADEDTFDALTDAIDAFIESQNYDEGSSGFTDEAVMDTFVGDKYLDQYNLTETYNVPKQPIVITSVVINRY